MKKVLGLLLILILSFVDATSYYVSNSGNDSLDGKSDATAWKTIGKVNSFNFSVGDDVYFRCGGTWEGTQLKIGWTGNENNYSIIGAYYGNGTIGVNGQRPIIRGGTYSSSNPIPAPKDDGTASWAGLVNIEKPQVGGIRDYIKVENLQILNSAGECLRYYAYWNNIGTNIEFRNLYIKNCTRSGITMSNCDNCVIENNKVEDTGNKVIEYDSTNWPSSIGIHRNSKNGLIKNNIVNGTHGEGIGIYFGGINHVIENNTIINSRRVGIDIDTDGEAGTIIKNNLIYNTKDSVYLTKGHFGGGILVGDITVGGSPYTKIYNNIMFNVWSGIDIGCLKTANRENRFDKMNCSNEPVRDVEINNNVIINWGDHAFAIHGLVDGCEFHNNIISGNGTARYLQNYRTGINYSNNIWYGGTGASYSGSGDILKNPFVEKNWSSIKKASPQDFMLLNNSPAINAGLKLGDEYSVDFFGNVRNGAWDIGAIEYGGAQIPIQENCNNSVDDDSDGLIDCLDSSCPACVVTVDVVDVSDIFEKISEWKAGQISLDDVFVVIRAWGEGGWL